MNELVKALKNFIVRDIIYIIGGASVILSFLYLFKKIGIITKDTPAAIYLLIAGIANFSPRPPRPPRLISTSFCPFSWPILFFFVGKF